MRDSTALGWLRVALRCTALALASLHAAVAATSQSMNEDGINYLDMGTAWMSGDWNTAINAIWSPLYACIVGAVITIIQPSPSWEFPVVQITNLAVFAVTMICFEFFWRQLTERYRGWQHAPGKGAHFPPAIWLTIGYSLFIWSSLNLIEIWAVTPDMLVGAVVYLSGGLLLRMSATPTVKTTVLLLGGVLGLGYLVKAALFPLGLVAIVLAAMVNSVSMRPAARLTWSLIPFALIAGPFVVAVSLTTGSPTFSDVGRFTYLKHVNKLWYPHWDESIEQVNGTPLHAPRRIFASPAVYEFAEPVGGTYPLSFDPGYWTRGLSPRIDVRQQLQAVISNVRFYFDLFVREQGAFVAVTLVLCVIAWRSGLRPGLRSAESALVIWALCAFGLYSLVYVTSRYVGAFVTIFWSGLLVGIRFPDVAMYRTLATTGGVVLVLAVWVNIAAVNVAALTAMLGFSPGLPTEARTPTDPDDQQFGGSDDHPAIAIGLQRLGLRDGDRVAFVGYSFSAFWARLARLRIIAEVPLTDERQFWSADAEHQSKVFDTLRNAGAVAVIAKTASIPGDWRSVGNTGYAVRFLR